MKRLLAALAAVVIAATAQTEVPVEREPMHHRTIENQYTRVYQVEVPPGQNTRLHRHSNDYVYVVFGESEIENEVQGRAPVKVKFRDGEARFAAGGFAHAVRDTGATPFRNVTIEVLKRSRQAVCGGPAVGVPETAVCPAVESANQDQSSRLVLETDSVRVVETRLEAGATLALHEHKLPHLAVAVSELRLRNQPEGKPASDIHQPAGSAAWVAAGVRHSITNAGKQTATWVTVEFK